MDSRYSVGCSIDNLKRVRDFLRGSLTERKVAADQISEIVLALDEMVSNLMIHAHQCNPDDMLEIRIDAVPPGPLEIEIIDNAGIFDINQFTEPSLDNIIHTKRKGGLGVRLVKSIMDKVEYYTRNGKSVCRLTKKVNYQS
jgi:serine/threonine-protein kinase RsbW